ncbi:MAG: UDP-N-acetylmuramoyl-L-alanine--D-glutamate ligase [Methyloprofundus sp.]|nr:UDP-N-acetylmuramoyl-L-alanine--D-glutamate ligase [Methyloprofundus sp.]
MDNDAILNRLKSQFSLERSTAKVLVVGLGKTGVSVAYYLRQLGFEFAVVDSRDKPSFNDELLEKMPDVPVFTGGFDNDIFQLATHIVVSPGISMQELIIQQALSRGVIALSDIDLLACSVNKPIVAITGSNGKSTVTTLLGEMAKADEVKVAIGGNLGTPALNLINDEIELYILELSSFQLERTTQLNATVSTVLNISEDHLDRYSGMDDYIRQKRHIFSGDGVMVINADDLEVVKMQDPSREVITFGIDNPADYHIKETEQGRFLAFKEQEILAVNELRILGRHNQANALAALALAKVVNLSEKAMCYALKHYKGLKNRMQFVADIKGVRWINDSKATNIGACIAALQGFEGKKIILIAGGDAKGANMSELLPSLIEKVQILLVIGKDAGLINQAVNDLIPVVEVGTLKKAVKEAKKIADVGNIVLLSPACASIDQFENYKERGKFFSSEVRALI